MTGPWRVPRLRACVEAWPDAETGGYDPKCCRWPKSCSATIYGDGVDPEWLEPVQTLAASIMAAPHGAWSCRMGGQPHAGTCNAPTPIDAPAETTGPTSIDTACDALSPEGAGWWHSDTADVVRAALGVLVERGMTLDDAVDLLAGVIGAVQNEYGD